MKKRTGCLGVIIFIILILAVFIFIPVPEKGDGIILSDAFENNDNGWDLQDTARIEKGQLVMEENSEAVIIPADINLKNGSITVDAEYKSGDTGSVFGVIFRSPADADGFDIFLIDYQGNFILRYNGERDITGTSGYISTEGVNSLKIELYGKLLRISVNGNTVTEAYEDNPAAGSFAFFSEGGSVVAFDNLEITDFDRRPADISGVVYYNDEKLPDAPVTAYRVVDEKTLKVVIIDETQTDEDGKYSFYLPEDSSYFVECTVDNGKTSSDRYTDLEIPDSGLDLDIHLNSEGK